MAHFYRYLAGPSLWLSLAGIALGQESVSLLRQDQKAVAVTSYAHVRGDCRGIAIVSPGAGGSEKGYSYLGEALSAQGYLAVVVGHQESGRQALTQHRHDSGLREGLSRLITDPDAYRGRFMDIAAAKHWAGDHCRATESILLGHSMGAATALIEAGAKNKLGVSGSNAFDIYVALSPQGVGSIFPPDAWREISRPVLAITGTQDDELGGGSWQTHTEPFRNMPAGCKWLGVIDGATHMNFAGRGMSHSTEALVVQTIPAFICGVHQGSCKSPPEGRGIEIQSG